MKLMVKVSLYISYMWSPWKANELPFPYLNLPLHVSGCSMLLHVYDRKLLGTYCQVPLSHAPIWHSIVYNMINTLVEHRSDSEYKNTSFLWWQTKQMHKWIKWRQWINMIIPLCLFSWRSNLIKQMVMFYTTAANFGIIHDKYTLI